MVWCWANVSVNMSQAKLESLKPIDPGHFRQLAQQTEQDFEERLKALAPYAKARA